MTKEIPRFEGEGEGESLERYLLGENGAEGNKGLLVSIQQTRPRTVRGETHGEEGPSIILLYLPELT